MSSQSTLNVCYYLPGRKRKIAKLNELNSWEDLTVENLSTSSSRNQTIVDHTTGNEFGREDSQEMTEIEAVDVVPVENNSTLSIRNRTTIDDEADNEFGINNYDLFRYYGNVVLATEGESEIPKYKDRVFLIRDFTITAADIILTDQMGYVIVTACTFSCNHKRLVSICGFCNRDLLMFYHLCSCSTENLQPSDCSKFLSCRHAIAVASHLLLSNGLNFDCNRVDLALALEDFIMADLHSADSILKPNAVLFKEFSYRDKKLGKLLVYISDTFNICLFFTGLSPRKRTFRIYCTECKRKDCTHIQSLIADPEYDTMDLPSTAADLSGSTPITPVTDYKPPELTSRKRYNFPIMKDAVLSSIVSNRLRKGLLEWFSEQFNSFTLVGNCCNYPVSYERTGIATIYSLSGFYEIRFPLDSKCMHCLRPYIFDGQEYGIVNYSNKHLFCIELLTDLLNLKFLDGTSTFSYWKSKLMMFYPHTYKTCEYRNMAGRVHAILTSFLQLIDYPESVTTCCEHPEVVCIDGIVLSADTQRMIARNLSSPWVLGTLPISDRFSKRKDRVLVEWNERSRDIIERFVKSGISLMEFNQLKSQEPSPKIISNFMESSYDITNTPSGQRFCCPAILRPLFQCFYKSIAPAAAILPRLLWTTVEAIIETQICEEHSLRIVGNASPIISSLLAFIFGKKLFVRGIPLLRLILKRSKQCYLSKTQTRHPVTYYTNPNPEDARESVLTTGAYFPKRPIVAGVYNLPLKNEAENVCNKQYHPGTILFWCGQHKKCLGFYTLAGAESLTQIHNILVSRFNPLPKVIIYDNGCNLHDYILNRCPQIYKNTIIMSDGFHWKNHTNCGSMYNSNAYESLRNFNSVLHEQMNAILDKLKPTSIHMRYESFVNMLIYCLAQINQAASE